MNGELQILSQSCAAPSADLGECPQPRASIRARTLCLALCALLGAALYAPLADAAAAGRHAAGSKEAAAFTVRLLEGARAEVARRPWYRSAYYAGGHPPAFEGVCTDLVWRAFAHAGYDLKTAMDADIRKNRSAYPRVTKPDANIDFRRVPNQAAFFRRHAKTLTTKIDGDNLASWLPGDIAVFANPDHIAIASDKHSKDGIPLLLHNQGPFATEGNDFMAWYNRGIIAHFRFIP